MKQKTPQEKKTLSYAKDRRNVYDENDKASRKNIPLRKAAQNRGFRKKQTQILRKSIGESDAERLEIIESELRNVRKGDWKKVPDAALGEFLQSQSERRKIRERRGKTTRKRIREIMNNLEIKTERLTENCWLATATNLSTNISADGETPDVAAEKLRYRINSAVANELGFDISILVDGKFIKPIL